jgi:hypothetical protein
LVSKTITLAHQPADNGETLRGLFTNTFFGDDEDAIHEDSKRQLGKANANQGEQVSRDLLDRIGSPSGSRRRRG